MAVRSGGGGVRLGQGGALGQGGYVYQ
jgi:hypothetical protein